MRLSVAGAVATGLAFIVAVIYVNAGRLKCSSYETLSENVSYSMESPNYQKSFPNGYHCSHYFHVDHTCDHPQFVCDDFDVSGNPPECKKTDKLKVQTNVDGRKIFKKFCGNHSISFSATGSSCMNFYFKIGPQNKNTGYSCEVFCGGNLANNSDTTAAPSLDESSTSCNCGIPNRVNRIVGGVETEINEYPWQVGLVLYRYGYGNTPVCGGSLISSDTVLTAAHCTDGSTNRDISVIVREHDTTTEDGEFMVNVKEIIQHPDYDSSTTDNDYSLLILETSVEFEQSVSPVCLPEGNSMGYENIEAIVSGWGTTFSGGQLSVTLQEVDVSTMSNIECTSGTQYSSWEITDNMICAAERNGQGGKDSCQGDSGGPLITHEMGAFYSQIGVVSWGYGCAEANAPGVYSRVTSKLQWIKDNMAGDTCKRIATETPNTTVNQLDNVSGTTHENITPDEHTSASTESCHCGVPNRSNRIIGGVETELNEYPWQVGLISGSFGNTPFCGGSIISSNTVLTAAHCTDGSTSNNLKVLIGEHDTTLNDGEFKVNVKEIIQHPRYDSVTFDNDYSLLILESSLTWRKSVKPVCVPGKKSEEYENTEAIVSGWGTTSNGGELSSALREVDVSTMSNIECTSGTQYSSWEITDNMICAAERNGHGGKDSCQGDSGGPLIAQESRESYSQIGVVSWGYGCAQESAPGVYSRVTSNLPWIKQNMQGSTCPIL